MNGIIAIIMLIGFIFIFRFAYRLDTVLNIYFGKWYLAYCVLIVGGVAYFIYRVTKYGFKPWNIVLLPFAIMGVFLLLRIFASMGTVPSAPGRTPFFDTTDPSKIDFWHYIWTGKLKA